MIACRFCNNKNNMKLNRFFASAKNGSENLFSNFLSQPDTSWVYVRDIENNLIYEGVVLSYSENDTIQEVLLSDVRIFHSEDGVF